MVDYSKWDIVSDVSSSEDECNNKPQRSASVEEDILKKMKAFSVEDMCEEASCAASWSSIGFSSLGDGGLDPSFAYPTGLLGFAKQKFDIRRDACRKHGGVVHGDAVLSEKGKIATVIGVRMQDGIPRLWCHMDGAKGAGLFSVNEEFRVLAEGLSVPEGGHSDGRAPSELCTWLDPTFTYMAGLGKNPAPAKFDIREDICKKVGGFRHGQVVQMPGGLRCVVIGVRKDPDNDTLNLWFHPKGRCGAGVFEHEDLKGLKPVGTETVVETLSRKTATQLKSCEQLELLCDFPYPVGMHQTTMEMFDIRPQTCNVFNGLSHGDIVLDEDGTVATVIGVRKDSERDDEAMLWCHMEGAKGAGIFGAGETLRIASKVPCVLPHGPRDGEAPSKTHAWLSATFTHTTGLRGRSIVAKFDIRDEICLGVGGFKHKQMVRTSYGLECETVGVRQDADDHTVALWFRPKGKNGAGTFEYDDLIKLQIVNKSSTTDFSPGCVVRIRGLKQSEELNGCRGILRKPGVSAKERSQVEIREKDGGKVIKLLRPENLILERLSRGGQASLHEASRKVKGVMQQQTLTSAPVENNPVRSSEDLWPGCVVRLKGLRKKSAKLNGRCGVVKQQNVTWHGCWQVDVWQIDGNCMVMMLPRDNLEDLRHAFISDEDFRKAFLSSAGGIAHQELELERQKCRDLKDQLKDLEEKVTQQRSHGQLIEEVKQAILADNDFSESLFDMVCSELHSKLHDEHSARLVAEAEVAALEKYVSSLEKELANCKTNSGHKNRVRQLSATLKVKESALRRAKEENEMTLIKKREEIREINEDADRFKSQCSQELQQKEKELVAEMQVKEATYQKELEEALTRAQSEKNLADQWLLQKQEALERLQREKQTLEQKLLEELHAQARQQSCSQEKVQPVISAKGYNWQFSENRGEWVSYTMEMNVNVMKAFLNGEKECMLTHGHARYMLDFDNLQQKNMSTGRIRDVRCQFGVPSHWAVSDADILKRLCPRASSDRISEADDTWSVTSSINHLVSQLRRTLGTEPDIPRPAFTPKGRFKINFESVTHRITCPNKLMEFTILLRDSAYHHDTTAFSGPSDCDRFARSFNVVEAYHVENLSLFKAYLGHCDRMSIRHLDHDIIPEPIHPPIRYALSTFSQQVGIPSSYSLALNECLLFHGTSWKTAKDIALDGFDSRLAKQGLYGKGTYFASQSCKSAQYGDNLGQKTMILARVALGDPFYLTEINQSLTRPPKRQSDDEAVCCDSVIARPGPMSNHFRGSQAHMEFVIFEQMQAYPEYILRYNLMGGDSD